MGQPFVGQVIAVGFNYAPPGWLPCNGQLLPIGEYQALYNLIGTTYGGDGQQTFAVPNLQGRSPLDAGQGPGRANYVLGQAAGAESITLTANQVGSHNHPMFASAKAGNVTKPANTVVLGQGSEPQTPVYAPPPSSTTSLAPSAIGGGSGGNQPHENRQPFSTVNYIIAYLGVYPSQ